ncbi:MAG TPA: phospholipase D-like domain-containing protein [Acidimicrobiales bacterium]|nr:phospholipase D-like domain-containing protein [Acidimicrobiales bacterium]
MTASAHADLPAPAATARVRRTLEGVLGVPATEGNAIDVLRNGDEIFPALFDAVAGAQHTIDFLTYVYWRGRVGTELAHLFAGRAEQGVRVRVLLDGFGARPIDADLIALMEDAGVQVAWFRPPRRLRPWELNHRTHRKVLVVDEAVGFTGGVGISDNWLGDARTPDEWRDTHFRVTGPAVDGLRSAFLDNWAETQPVLFEDGVDRFPDQPQPGGAVVQCIRGASETGWSDVATLYRTLLQLAEREVRITTAYFVPDADLSQRMCDAADRGVRVRLLLPGPHADKRFVQLAGEEAYGTLLDHGIEIWNFQPSMLHAKVMTVDGLIANIGSANLNARSVSWDEEINLVVLDPELAGTLDAQFEEDLDRSVRIERSRWRRRSVAQQAFEAVVSTARRFF